MTTEEFVKKLKELTPSAATFANKGLPEEYVKKLIDSFNCERKKDSSFYSDPLLNLIDCYNADIIQIGAIDFSKNIVEEDRYYIVGELEVDWLVVDKYTGVVKVVEKYNYHEMWDCAADSSRFLEAILETVKFFNMCSLDNNIRKDQKVAHAVAETCTEIAGGDKYSDFYKMFVGAW